MTTDIPSFASLGWWPGPRLGRHRGVRPDRDNPGLQGQNVIIDGEEFICLGVECSRIKPPIRAGEEIGLLVRERGGFRTAEVRHK